jgi:uncharacterized membrane protein YhaH (DUF805 family)
MIYKFIDNNGSEISVNSLSSLQALVDSEMVKENTKIKAGLRGKWTTASKIQELVFIKEVIPEVEAEEVIPEAEAEEVIPEAEAEEVIPEAEAEEVIPEAEAEEVIPEAEAEEEKSEYELEEDKIDKAYDDENIIGLNLFKAMQICFKKFFNFKDRASRSEYWYFQLVFAIVSLPLFIYEDSSNDTHLIYTGISAIIVLILFIPAISVSVRRLHDINKSGWFVIISVIPYIGWIILAIMLIGKGTLGKNKFGKYPLKFK